MSSYVGQTEVANGECVRVNKSINHWTGVTSAVGDKGRPVNQRILKLTNLFKYFISI